jgi:integrase
MGEPCKRRHHNDGLRKLCKCAWRSWPKCAHPWHFNFKVRGGAAYRFSLDAELRRHIESKTEAETEAGNIRTAILNGTFRRAADMPAPAPAAPTGVTLDAFAAIYVDRVSKASGKTSWKDDKIRLGKVREYRAADGRRLGDWPIERITEDELEAFHAGLMDTRSASTRNHYVRLIKAACRWAAKKGYLARSPISEDSALKVTKPAQRSQRLSPAEETRLLAAAGAVSRGVGARLQRLIVAAIETGCRRGELLGLQWADVNLDRKELLVRAENAKDDEARRLPISTRLAAVLEMARTDPAGQSYPLAAYVFGDCGQRIQGIKKAWTTARNSAGLPGLHFHDLRHEAGSRLLEAGWPLHHVREMLGHASIETTDRYLNAGRMGLHDSMRRFEIPAPCNPVANEQTIEPRPDRNEETDASGKAQLH